MNFGYLREELRQAIFEDLRGHEVCERYLEPSGVVLQDVRVQLIQIHDEFRARIELSLLQQGVNVMQDVTRIGLERLKEQGICLSKWLHAMNDRDEGINDGVSEFVVSLLLFRVLRWLQRDLTSHEEAVY